MTELCEKHAELHDVLCNGSNRKILVHNKKHTDPHVEVNCMNVSTREKSIHLGNVLSTSEQYVYLYHSQFTFSFP